MRVEYRLLGPLEAEVDGRPARLGAPKQRATLVLLLCQANTVVPAARLVDSLWPEPPRSASNVVQGYVSGLRKALGRDAIETQGAGYIVRVAPGALDLHRFEQLAQEGTRALERGDAASAADSLGRALALWRGPVLADLADEDALASVVARLDELRVLALERRMEAELALGRSSELVSELDQLVREHPLREKTRGLLMEALYRSGRQAEALEAYRSARSVLVEELGIEPSAWLAELHAAMLRQDPRLASVTAERTETMRSILVAGLTVERLDRLARLAAPLTRLPARELLLVTTVPSIGELKPAGVKLEAVREALLAEDVSVRVAAFTSIAPGADMARLALEQDVDLVLVDAPAGLLEDARVLALLDQAPCDVGVVVDGQDASGPIHVPFAGADHDWAAVELGAWLAQSRDTSLRLLGATTGGEGRDASRLLAHASLAVQRALGVPAEPVLVEPEPAALVDAVAGAGVIVVGLTDRWRREGLGRMRTALATQATSPTVLVRRGTRPGGLAPRGTETRYTWTIVS